MKKYKCIIFIMGLLTVFSLAGMSSSVFANNNEDSRETLKGLNGILVIIEGLKTWQKQAGLSESQIQTDVELKLRLAGIKVLNEEEFFKEKGHPCIYININNLEQKLEGFLVYNISCRFRQYIFLERNPSIKALATTWSQGWIGCGDIERLRAKIKDIVDEFINAYLSVNPKK